MATTTSTTKAAKDDVPPGESEEDATHVLTLADGTRAFTSSPVATVHNGQAVVGRYLVHREEV